MDSPFHLVYGGIVILLIVYSAQVPLYLRAFMDSLLGRVLGMFWIYLAVEGLGWVYGLLTALAFLSLLYQSPSSPMNPVEGFDGGGTVTEKKRVGKRWFVERVLGEHPAKIATDKVSTLPVQD